jgi:hypothetical protein
MKTTSPAACLSRMGVEDGGEWVVLELPAI